jgi:hypothetical protein
MRTVSLFLVWGSCVKQLARTLEITIVMGPLSTLSLITASQFTLFQENSIKGNLQYSSQEYKYTYKTII